MQVGGGLPARKVDPPFVGRPLLPFNPKDPFHRQQNLEGTRREGEGQGQEEEEVGGGKNEIFFDGDVLNISLPIRAEGEDGGEDETLGTEIEDLLGGVLTEAFHPGEGKGSSEAPPPRVKVTVDRVDDRIVINAEGVGREAGGVRDASAGGSGGSAFAPSRKQDVPPVVDVTRGHGADDAFAGADGVVFGGDGGVAPTRPASSSGGLNVVKFGLEDAITTAFPPSASTPPPGRRGGGEDGGGEANDLEDFGGDVFYRGGANVPDVSAGVGNSVVEDEDEEAVDSYLNSVLFGGGRGSSADIVQATVVEDLDFARRVRDQRVSERFSLFLLAWKLSLILHARTTIFHVPTNIDSVINASDIDEIFRYI